MKWAIAQIVIVFYAAFVDFAVGSNVRQQAWLKDVNTTVYNNGLLNQNSRFISRHAACLGEPDVIVVLEPSDIYRKAEAGKYLASFLQQHPGFENAVLENRQIPV